MNTTNRDYFTFNVDNSILLVGQTASGKTILQDAIVERYVNAHAPETLQFVILDMTGVDYYDLQDKHTDFIKIYLKHDSEKGLQILDEMADLAIERSKSNITEPLIVIGIEECDMAAVDQKRFDLAVMKINQNAKQANMKLIYSTSRPAPDVVSKELMDSFDLILAGTLATEADSEYLGIPNGHNTKYYDFAIKQNKSNPVPGSS